MQLKFYQMFANNNPLMYRSPIFPTISIVYRIKMIHEEHKNGCFLIHLSFESLDLWAVIMIYMNWPFDLRNAPSTNHCVKYMRQVLEDRWCPHSTLNAFIYQLQTAIVSFDWVRLLDMPTLHSHVMYRRMNRKWKRDISTEGVIEHDIKNLTLHFNVIYIKCMFIFWSRPNEHQTSNIKYQQYQWILRQLFNFSVLIQLQAFSVEFN